MYSSMLCYHPMWPSGLKSQDPGEFVHPATSFAYSSALNQLGFVAAVDVLKVSSISTAVLNTFFFFCPIFYIFSGLDF